MVMCIQRKIFVMDWKIPPSSLKQNAIPAPRGFAPRVWNLHFAFVIRVEFFNPSLKFSLDSLNSTKRWVAIVIGLENSKRIDNHCKFS